MIRPTKTFLSVTAVVLALGLAPATAAATKPAKKKPACWKVLINDWYDGTVDGKYALGCYRGALKRLKGETYALGYTSAYDDINRAYQQRRAELAGRRFPADTSGGDQAGYPTSPSKSGGGGTSVNPVAPDRWYPPADAPIQKTAPGGPVGELAKTLGPDDATSIPIPLIILAGIAALLMTAGTASLIARRVQRRRITVPVRPAPPARGN